IETDCTSKVVLRHFLGGRGQSRVGASNLLETVEDRLIEQGIAARTTHSKVADAKIVLDLDIDLRDETSTLVFRDQSRDAPPVPKERIEPCSIEVARFGFLGGAFFDSAGISFLLSLFCDLGEYLRPIAKPA